MSGQAQSETKLPDSDAFSARGEVVGSLSNSLVAQFQLGAPYSYCLYASYGKLQQKENGPHSFFLKQIDLLSDNGLSPAEIVGIISYGHALSNFSYASDKNKRLMDLSVKDAQKMRDHELKFFEDNNCMMYSEEDARKLIKKSVQAVVENR